MEIKCPPYLSISKSFRGEGPLIPQSKIVLTKAISTMTVELWKLIHFSTLVSPSANPVLEDK